ncbi:MAG: asparagine synthase (glutamine-hydrolyzing) [Nitrospirota bacterium]
MCGICGSYSLLGEYAARQDVEKMTATMRHRGPDGSGVYIKGPLGLGHRRLSIIDIEGGSQPMTNETNEIYLVFNGEIYNYIELRDILEKKGHVFKTNSDTEVIIHSYEEWGIDTVKKFNGIFAFALWDSRIPQLLLARDHLGVKPLYYIFLKGKLLFASEIKALLTDTNCPREVDIESLGQLFTFRYVPSPRTLFKSIKKLSPGHIMTVNERGYDIRQYWDWNPRIDNECTIDDLIEKYQYLLEDAIKLQMRSDVPIGLFLSSGVDSSTILALMSRMSEKPVYTFTIGFEGGEKTNELDGSRKIAKMFGADHSEMILGPTDYEKYYDRYLMDLEEPVGHESAAAFYFVSKKASEKVKVAMCGQGADEPWAGYNRYIGAKLSDIYCKLPAFLIDDIVKPLVFSLPKNELLKRGVVSLGERDILTRFAKMYSFYRDDMKVRLFRGWVKEKLSGLPCEAKYALRHLQTPVQHLDTLSQMLYIDTRASLPDDLLMVADKTSMANSLEVRVPFLDYRLIEFVETVPPQYKLRGISGKYLHKKSVEKWLPKKIIYRKKKGFTNPMEIWLRDKMQECVNSRLLSADSASKRYFDDGYIREMINLHNQQKENYTRHINLLLSFEMWHRKFIGK